MRLATQFAVPEGERRLRGHLPVRGALVPAAHVLHLPHAGRNGRNRPPVLPEVSVRPPPALNFPPNERNPFASQLPNQPDRVPDPADRRRLRRVPDALRRLLAGRFADHQDLLRHLLESDGEARLRLDRKLPVRQVREQDRKLQRVSDNRFAYVRCNNSRRERDASTLLFLTPAIMARGRRGKL